MKVALHKLIVFDENYVPGTLLDLVVPSVESSTGGCDLRELFSSNDDPTLKTYLTFYLRDESNTMPIGGGALSPKAGVDLVTPVPIDNFNQLITRFSNSVDDNGNKLLTIEPGWKLQCSLNNSVGVGHRVFVAALGGVY